MTWHNGFLEWTENNTAYLSVIFSWHLPQAFQRAIWYSSLGYHVRAGGPAVANNPNYLKRVTEIGGHIDALPRHNPDATFTTRGCIRNCPFCIVPKIEGQLYEVDLSTWEPKPIICDNNLLAASWAHFSGVIDRLKPLKDIDFNQGLDARLLTKRHAERLAELDLHAIRLSWDFLGMEQQFLHAFQTLRDANIPASKIRVYCLIGFNDTPEDALYRLETIRRLGALPNPSRYQPLDAMIRNAYVGEHWTERELRRYMRYWYRQRWLKNVPFEEYRYGIADRIIDLKEAAP